MKFKVGDRVAVYSGLGRAVAIITDVQDGLIHIWVHPKQGRLLRPKKRREIWIDCKNSGISCTSNKLDQKVNLFGNEYGTFSRFVEAKEKK